MSKIVTLLSGKGGSGKTTLALSMASLLSDCGIKVLLVDCDLSTNGATYFYENKLADSDDKVISFSDVLYKREDAFKKMITINECMDFMPSIVRITKKNTGTYQYDTKDMEIMQCFKNLYEKKYDVILFDCQAGYTDILKLLLPIVDINLVVMEADAISSASIRSLYLKIGEYLNDKNIYQIFNKATEEEYQVYSKLSGGTVFTNIETVRFDWKIRKAFSVAEIPDLKQSSANYGVQIYNICRILFKEEKIQAKINKYGIVLEMNKCEEEARELQEKLMKLSDEKMNSKNRMRRITSLFMALAFGSLFCFAFYEAIDKKIFSGYDEHSLLFLFPLMFLSVVLFVTCFLLLDMTKEIRNRHERMDMYRDQLRSVHIDKMDLQKKYEKLGEAEE